MIHWTGDESFKLFQRKLLNVFGFKEGLPFALMLSALSKYTRGSCKSYGVKVRPNHRKNVTRDKPLFWDNNPSFEEFIVTITIPGAYFHVQKNWIKEIFYSYTESYTKLF